MTFGGTDMYGDDSWRGDGMPPLVSHAVAAARSIGFDLCVHPATGRLLQVLAGGLPAGSNVGETGTGTGAGLAWMASSADPGLQLVSAEIDAARAQTAQAVFADDDRVTVLAEDNSALSRYRPFDLLVLDGGPGSGKGGERDEPLRPAEWLNEGGLIVIDDYTPMDSWPPMYDGQLDRSRLHWLQHPDLLTTEIRVAADMAVLVGRRTSRHPAK